MEPRHSYPMTNPWTRSLEHRLQPEARVSWNPFEENIDDARFELEAQYSSWKIQGYHTRDEERHMKEWFHAKTYQLDKIEDLRKQLSIWQNRSSEPYNEFTNSVGQDQEIKRLSKEVEKWKDTAIEEKNQRLASENQLHIQLAGYKRNLTVYYGVKVEGGHGEFINKVRRLEDALHLEGTLHEMRIRQLERDHELQVLDLQTLLQAEREKRVAARDRENLLTRDYRKKRREMVDTCKGAHENEVTRLEKDLTEKTHQLERARKLGEWHDLQIHTLENQNERLEEGLEKYIQDLRYAECYAEEAEEEVDSLKERLRRFEFPAEKPKGAEDMSLKDIGEMWLNTPE